MRRISIAILLTTVPAWAASCDGLAKLALPHTTVTTAEITSAWPTVLRGVPAAPKQPFCRIAAILQPTADSHIAIEIWMPESGWNGKYEAVGNGGWSGSIAYNAMVAAIGAGYATSST